MILIYWMILIIEDKDIEDKDKKIIKKLLKIN